MAILGKFGRKRAQEDRVWHGKSGFVLERKGVVRFFAAQAAGPGPAYECEMQQSNEGTVHIRVRSGSEVVCEEQFADGLMGAIKALEGWKRRFLAMAGVTPLWRRVLLGVGVALLVIVLVPTGYNANRGVNPVVSAAANPQSPALPYLPPAYGPQPAAAPTAAASAPARFSKELMAEIAAQHAIITGNPKGKPFYVFESTTCESCQDLDSKMAEIGKDWRVVELPVGFDPIARKQAAGAYCAKDPAAALHAAMTGLVDTTAQDCKAGEQDIDENNRLFIKLGLTQTPILVTASGNVAVGTAPADKVEAWLSAH
jgi:protein-disulfide isomerase